MRTSFAKFLPAWLRERLPRELEQGNPVKRARAPAGHIGTRRQDCWWEPIYAPEISLEAEPYDWDISRDSGPNNRFISGDVLTNIAKKGDVFKVHDITFKNCDFQGQFGDGAFLMFDDCKFIGCDFAYSSWKYANFRICTFSNSSISLSSFDDSEFRDCIWHNVGVASKTEFRRTFLNNPSAFIKATISQTNPDVPTFKHKAFQWFRLKNSRAHVLRNLLISHQSVGDEHTFYETVKSHELARSIARVCHNSYDVGFSKGKRIASCVAFVFHALEYVVLSAFGWLNNWGASAVKPLIALLSCFGIFGLLFDRYRFEQQIPSPWQKSFDLTFLVGYGNQQTTDKFLSAVQNVQVLIAIVIYTVFFATAVSKLSRAR